MAPDPSQYAPCRECDGDIYVCSHGPAAQCDADYPHGSRLCAACEGTGLSERFEAGLSRHAASGASNPFVLDDDPCAFGDPCCPCQDDDACHYVDVPGSPAMTPPGEETDPDHRHPTYGQLEAAIVELRSQLDEALRLLSVPMSEMNTAHGAECDSFLQYALGAHSGGDAR